MVFPESNTVFWINITQICGSPLAGNYFTLLIVILKLKLVTCCGCLQLTKDPYQDRFPGSSLILYCCNNRGTKSHSSTYENCFFSFISSKIRLFSLQTLWLNGFTFAPLSKSLFGIQIMAFFALSLLCFQGFKLSSVMTSWKFTMAPICFHLWLDPSTEPKSLSSCLAVVTSCICSSPLTTVDQTVASRYSMKVRFLFIHLFDWHMSTLFFHT